MFCIYEVQQNLYECKYFYNCVHNICTISKLCQGEWHRKNYSSQLTFTCSKSRMETVEKGVKYVQS